VIETTTTAPRRKSVTVDGCTVSYVRAGRGPALLFLHGGGGVRGTEAFIARLAERFDVVVPDHPGFGHSDTPPWLDNIHDLAYFYLDFVEALGLREVHVVGHSLGGWIACEIAIRNVVDLKTLALVASAGLRLPGVQKLDTFLMSPEARAEQQFFDPALAAAAIAERTGEELLEIQLKNRYAFALLAWQPRLYDPDLAKWMHRIKVPTLILWGDSDRIIPPPYAEEFQRLIPRSSVETIARCGHLPHIEQSDAFVASVTRFVETNAAGGRLP
jgi:pimeloyl-ACP methyl ester carboxylesterase